MDQRSRPEGIQPQPVSVGQSYHVVIDTAEKGPVIVFTLRAPRATEVAAHEGRHRRQQSIDGEERGSEVHLTGDRVDDPGLVHLRRPKRLIEPDKERRHEMTGLPLGFGMTHWFMAAMIPQNHNDRILQQTLLA